MIQYQGSESWQKSDWKHFEGEEETRRPYGSEISADAFVAAIDRIDEEKERAKPVEDMQWHVYKGKERNYFIHKGDTNSLLTYEPYCNARWVHAFPTLALAQAFTVTR
jgi:hypothetical protein